MTEFYRENHAHQTFDFVLQKKTEYCGLNRGKKSVDLNLKSPDGLALFQSLTAKADVVIEGMRAGMLGRLGVGYDDIKDRVPSGEGA